MNQKTIDTLIELNKLYEAGILTKEEIEAEKRKLLDSESEENASVNESVGGEASVVLIERNSGEVGGSDNILSSPQQAKSFHDTKFSRIHNKWWIIGGLGALCLIILLIVANHKEQPTVYNYDVVTDIEELADTVIEDDYTEYTLDDLYYSDSDVERVDLWFKSYFQNEWEEDMPEHPYISRYISSNVWNLDILYSHEVGFRFAIYDDDHRISPIYSPASLLFRDSDGNTYEIIPESVDNYMVYVRNSDDVRLIAQLLDSGKLDIIMRYEKYLEPHSSRWAYNDLPGIFMKAVELLLPL